MRGKKLYKALGLSASASPDEVKKTFRKLARRYHPDRNPGDEKAEKRFKEISAAHEVLSDPKRKALYDQYGDMSLKQGFDPNMAGAFGGGSGGFGGGSGGFGGGDIDDLLGSLFGAGRGRRQGGPGGRSADPFAGFGGAPARGADTRADLRVDFMTAATGGEHEVILGDGRRMKVRVPAGASDGATLRLRGQGRPLRTGGPAGDLLLAVKVDAHAHFVRDGDDVTVRVPLTVPEAVRGARIRVPTLTGAVRVTVPAGARSGQRLRITGKGIARRGKPTGNLYAELHIVPPAALDDATLEVLEQAYPDDVRAALLEASPPAP
jgi:DnaJ-class molecular chaperone